MASARSRLVSSTLAVVVLLTLLLGACSDGEDDGASTDASDPSAEGGESGETVTVEHLYGSTEVPVGPERVVSLDTQWTDVLTALDAPPTGYLLDPNVDGGVFPWQGDLLDESTGIEATDALPYEEVAALEPDLIVVTYLAQDEGDYELLSEIAPTIPLLSTDPDQVDSWQEITAVAGDVLAVPDEAAALVDQVDATVDAVAAELPELEGQTFALANFVPGDAIYVVADPDDGANVLFAQLGLELPAPLLDAADDVSGRVELSLEQTELLDADVLVLFTNGAEPEELSGYEQLPAVETGAVALLDYGEVVGLNTPTPLSVPYSLELIRPALVAAAGSAT
jgi:iron complex transport system substrate-binding protein